MVMVIITFFLFMLGFLLNGFYPDKYKFDLKALLGMIGTITTGSITMMVKHYIDSKFNSSPGTMPGIAGEAINGSKDLPSSNF